MICIARPWPVMPNTVSARPSLVDEPFDPDEETRDIDFGDGDDVEPGDEDFDLEEDTYVYDDEEDFDQDWDEPDEDDEDFEPTRDDSDYEPRPHDYDPRREW